MTNLLFGCGYLGERVARRWRDAGHEITIVTRSDERAAAFEREGYRAIVADITQPATLRNLPAADTALFSVGFDRTAGGSIEHVYAGGLANVLAALPSTIPHVLYISTTGVYGNGRDGEWVDELTPPDPQRDGGRASLAAEQVLASHSLGKNSVILRLAGIYGPGRIPFLDKLRAGEPIPVATEGYLNLIHVDDAATAVTAADQLPPANNSPRIFCVSDGHPATRGDYYREVARLLDAAPPTFMKPDLNSPRDARAEANRRINNSRMLADLGVTLQFPDYRAGLAAILAHA